MPILRGDQLTATEEIARLNHFSQLARTENRVVLFAMEKNVFSVGGRSVHCHQTDRLRERLSPTAPKPKSGPIS